MRGEKRAVSGKIDRLAVTEREVLIVDYKTNRPAPHGLEAVPPAYVAQLALYRALLQPVYPGRTVVRRAAVHRGAAPGRPAGGAPWTKPLSDSRKA